MHTLLIAYDWWSPLTIGVRYHLILYVPSEPRCLLLGLLGSVKHGASVCDAKWRQPMVERNVQIWRKIEKISPVRSMSENRGGFRNLRKGAGPSHSLPLPFFSPIPLSLFSLPLRSLPLLLWLDGRGHALVSIACLTTLCHTARSVAFYLSVCTLHLRSRVP